MNPSIRFLPLTLRSRVVRTLLGATAPLTFDDSCGSWEEATARAGGYDSTEILDRVTQSTKAVMAGDALFERDGVLFHEPEYRWPVAYALEASVARHNELRVLDVGGSLGSVYWQHRALLMGKIASWTVIEQPNFVERGRTLNAAPLSFATDLLEARRFGPWNMALMSSVMQYLPHPWQALTSILDSGIDFLVIDRTPFHAGDSDIPTVQRVPEHIYSASYPAWIMSESRLTTALDGWRIIARFPGIEPPMRTRRGVEFAWSGLIATRTTS